MNESVTLPKLLLDQRTIEAHLAVLASNEGQRSAARHGFRYPSERERIQELLDLVNSESADVSPERRSALRAFLGERVAVRERATLLSPRLEADNAKHGVRRANSVPHRTLALSLAAKALPNLLNGHVQKSMYFLNAGSGKAVTKRSRTGEIVSQVHEGPGGELAVIEYVDCDRLETVLNYALALVLAKNYSYGLNLCRCHADGCGRFWLLPDKLTGKPSRNFCSRHEADKKRLSDAERKRRQRAQPTIKRRK
jgi:hypothetical protein